MDQLLKVKLKFSFDGLFCKLNFEGGKKNEENGFEEGYSEAKEVSFRRQNLRFTELPGFFSSPSDESISA